MVDGRDALALLEIFEQKFGARVRGDDEITNYNQCRVLIYAYTAEMMLKGEISTKPVRPATPVYSEIKPPKDYRPPSIGDARQEMLEYSEQLKDSRVQRVQRFFGPLDRRDGKIDKVVRSKLINLLDEAEKEVPGILECHGISLEDRSV